MMKRVLPLKEVSLISKKSLAEAVGLKERYRLTNREHRLQACASYGAGSGGLESLSYYKDNLRYDEPLNFQGLGLDTNASIKRQGANSIKSTMIVLGRDYGVELVEEIDYKRLSRLQLLQYLFYHFCSVDSNGIIKNMQAKEVARVLRCTENSVDINNRVLEERGFIALSKISAREYNIIILGYKDNRKTKEQGGTGYLHMTLEMLQHMLIMENPNTLRLAIRKYIKCDSNEGILRKAEGIFSYKELKDFLPKGLSKDSLIKASISSGFFEESLEPQGVKFILRDEYNGKKQRRCKEDIHRERILMLLEKSRAKAHRSSIDDLVQLSLEYGMDSLKAALDRLLSAPESSSIENLGACVRQHIRRSTSLKAMSGYKN